MTYDSFQEFSKVATALLQRQHEYATWSLCIMVVTEATRVLFFGSGSLGTLIASLLKLRQPQLSIILLGRLSRLHAVLSTGLRVVQPDGSTIETPPLPVQESFHTAVGDPFDVVFVTCKAVDNHQAVRVMEKNNLVGRETKIALVQNGAGNEEVFSSIVPKEHIYRVVTSEGAFLDNNGQMYHFGPSQTFVGRYFGQNDLFVETLVNWFNLIEFPTSSSTQIQREVWTKVLINSAINPLATLEGVRNGLLLERENLRERVELVVAEIVEVYKRANVPYLTSAEPVEGVWKVVRATASNKCSMLQDIEGGRKTEIDYLNGRIVEVAQIFGVDVPTNLYLTQQIKALERGTGER